MAQQQNSNRGFAAMDEEKQREIASKGGQAVHEKGRAHEFDSEEAAEAGRKGGEAVSKDRAHMAEIGARGGHARGGGQTSFSRSEQPTSTRGGTPEQHARAGRQSHKNDRRSS